MRMGVLAVLLASGACARSEAGDLAVRDGGNPSAVSSPPVPQEPAASRPRVGTVEGSVTLSGPRPKPKPLEKPHDPFCAAARPKDERVLVSAKGALRNVIVRVKDAPKSADPPASPFVLTQDRCTYRPRVGGVIAGQTIAIKNADDTMHNVHTYQGQRTLTNRVQLPGTPDIEQPTRRDAEPILKFACDVHPWMAAYVLVSDHPFFAVTGEDGAFTLKDVPAGKHTIEAWHELLGVQTREVDVQPDGRSAVTFSFSPQPASRSR